MTKIQKFIYYAVIMVSAIGGAIVGYGSVILFAYTLGLGIIPSAILAFACDVVYGVAVYLSTKMLNRKFF